MKKLFAAVLAVILLSGAAPQIRAASPAGADPAGKIISLTIGSPIMTVNGAARRLDGVPLIENGRTLVPLRAIFEALGAGVDWDAAAQTVTGTRGKTVIRLTVGSPDAYVNGVRIRLETAPEAVNGRTMVPLRFIAESLGAEVQWLPETRMVIIAQNAGYIAINGAAIGIGDTLADLTGRLGAADRIDPSCYGFDWYVYNGDYSRFIMAGVKNGVVEALYTDSKGFATNGAKYGDAGVSAGPGAKFYFDNNDGGRLYACMIISGDAASADYGSDFYAAQEMENFDATNAFRVSHGMAPLAYDEAAARAARLHSQDMADRNYFSHYSPEGYWVPDWYAKGGGGLYRYIGENISGGHLLGVDAFDGWVNSAKHREGMLGDYAYLGVGYGHNPNSQYEYYITQIFILPQ
ncbi:MAG: stalk domain-containing protein [Firmicutes bacterium]|nr:stalk domain-containing protein [Bacillota bacterium]